MRPSYLRGETKAIIRKVPFVRSRKQIIVLIFIFLYFFCSQPCSIRARFFSLFDTFSHLRNVKKIEFSVESLTCFVATCFVGSTKLSPIRHVSTWMGDQIQIPCVVITFSAFSLSFCNAILKTEELPSLCNVVSFIYQLLVPHFAMAVFICIYLHYRINKQRDMFEFSSILTTAR